MRFGLAILCALAVCSCTDTDAPVVEADRAALGRIAPADAVQFLAQIGQVHAFQIRLANTTLTPCLYSPAEMGPTQALLLSYSLWSYTHFSDQDVMEGRRVYAVLAGATVADDVACVVYSRSAPTITPEIKQEIQDVATALEALKIPNRRFLTRM